MRWRKRHLRLGGRWGLIVRPCAEIIRRVGYECDSGKWRHRGDAMCLVFRGCGRGWHRGPCRGRSPPDAHSLLKLVVLHTVQNHPTAAHFRPEPATKNHHTQPANSEGPLPVPRVCPNPRLQIAHRPFFQNLPLPTRGHRRTPAHPRPPHIPTLGKPCPNPPPKTLTPPNTYRANIPPTTN